MDQLFTNLKKMYDLELYSSVIPLASIILSSYTRDRMLLTAEQHFLTLAYYGNSLKIEGQYRKAELYLKQALQAKKTQIKLKTNIDNLLAYGDRFSEVELKFQLAQCLEQIRQYQEAVLVLQSVPVKQRSPKVHMLLAKLLQQNRPDRTAISSYREVLKECPLNFEAIKGLAMLEVKASEINSLIDKSSTLLTNTDWLSNLITAYTYIYSCKFQQSIQALLTIEENSIIGDNENILVLLGECYYYNGNYDSALHYLSRAHNNSPFLGNGLMTLASLFAIKKRNEDLEKLTNLTIVPVEYSAEHWFVFALYLYCQGKHDKAAYFAQKSCYINTKNTEATLLKVKILMELKKYKDAIGCLRTLQQHANYRFEVYEALIDAYIGMERLREANSIGTTALRTLGKSPRTIVLAARPYLHGTTTKARAKLFLNKALEMDEHFLPAVTALVDLCLEEGDIVQAKKLLTKQIEYRPSSNLYTLLGDINSKTKDHTKAVENYTIALTLDPSNRKAIDGLSSLRLMSPNAKPCDFDGDIEPGADSPQNVLGEAVEAESESDALWSDVEIEVDNV